MRNATVMRKSRLKKAEFMDRLEKMQREQQKAIRNRK